MNKLFPILALSFVLSQGNYQILSTCTNFNNIFKVPEFYESKEYMIFNSSLPAGVNIFSVTASSGLLKKLSLKNLYFLTLKNINYGRLRDNITNYSFGAKESLIEISLLKKKVQKQTDIMFSMGYLKSSIDIFDSEAIYISLKSRSEVFKDDVITFSLDNFGKVINNYHNDNIGLPETINISYTINDKSPFSTFLSYKKRLDFESEILHGTINIKVNQKLDVYISTHSNRSDLFYGDYIQKIIAGTSIGFGYYSGSNLFNLAIQDLGAAGQSTSISFSKVIL
ncbi:MAG: hypothetical protein CMG00_07155 [Candidatus Marinimicrobia bacterium]|nr:hypothetical protein [Candidatus Neomarinimicrobiota bacterium]|tara:strand:- start:36442 stop:37287 length:846 start_codon:yes stop_codon:yes gene_type:complete